VREEGVVMIAREELTAGNSDELHSMGALREGARRRERETLYQLALKFLNGEEVPRNAILAKFWCRKAARQGHIAAQRLLGDLYASGEAGVRDLRAAAAWYRRASYQRDPIAMYKLGVAFLEGVGVLQSLPQARVWFERAAELGQQEAGIKWVQLLLEGGATADELVKARRYLAQFADHPAAGEFLARIEERGRA
jgi:uncharacterized protein